MRLLEATHVVPAVMDAATGDQVQFGDSSFADLIDAPEGRPNP